MAMALYNNLAGASWDGGETNFGGMGSGDDLHGWMSGPLMDLMTAKQDTIGGKQTLSPLLLGSGVDGPAPAGAATVMVLSVDARMLRVKPIPCPATTTGIPNITRLTCYPGTILSPVLAT